MTAYFDDLRSALDEAQALDQAAQFDRADKLERMLVRDVTLAVFLLRRDLSEALRVAIHTSIRAWQLVTLSPGQKAAPQADAAECHVARLCSLTEELHDLFHAVGIDVRVKRGRGGYDDPMTAILDAVGEEEEFRDTLPLRPGGAAQELT